MWFDEEDIWIHVKGRRVGNEAQASRMACQAVDVWFERMDHREIIGQQSVQSSGSAQ